MSATTGMGLIRFTCARATAASISGTAQRTISQPTSASTLIWAIVVETSRVSVLHIDCTEQGASPPIGTRPICICLVSFFMAGHIAKDGRESQERRAVSRAMLTIQETIPRRSFRGLKKQRYCHTGSIQYRLQHPEGMAPTLVNSMVTAFTTS